MSCYGEMARYYDVLMSDVDYERWVEYLERLMASLGQRPENILEIGCGTGNIANILARKGYRVMASDISEDMLAVAQAKAHDMGVKVTYIHQDMRYIRLNAPVDCVVSVCDGINYILKDEDLKRVFKGVYNVLGEKGIFIFDINSRYKLSEIIGDNTFGESGEDISFLWENSYDPDTAICEFHLTFFVKTKDGLYSRFEESHSQRAYSVEEICGCLQECGFRVAGIYEAFTLGNPGEESERINFVAVRDNIDIKNIGMINSV